MSSKLLPGFILRTILLLLLNFWFHPSLHKFLWNCCYTVKDTTCAHFKIDTAHYTINLARILVEISGVDHTVPQGRILVVYIVRWGGRWWFRRDLLPLGSSLGLHLSPIQIKTLYFFKKENEQRKKKKQLWANHSEWLYDLCSDRPSLALDWQLSDPSVDWWLTC